MHFCMKMVAAVEIVEAEGAQYALTTRDWTLAILVVVQVTEASPKVATCAKTMFQVTSVHR